MVNNGDGGFGLSDVGLQKPPGPEEGEAAAEGADGVPSLPTILESMTGVKDLRSTR